MKKIRTIISACLVALSVVGLNSIKANASTRWIKDYTGWWYQIDSTWAVGWKQIDGKWYYFDSNGYMKHDCYIDIYYLGSDGAWTSDPNKKLSSGLTLFEAAQKIQSTINNLKNMGETVDNNMDYINEQCEKLGTTYQEVSKLPVDVMNQTEAKKVETKVQQMQQGSSSGYNFGTAGASSAGNNTVTNNSGNKGYNASTSQSSSGNKGQMSDEEFLKQWREKLDRADNYTFVGGGTTTVDYDFDARMNRANN